MDYTKLTVSELANGISQTEAAIGRVSEVETTIYAANSNSRPWAPPFRV